jgi:hypothetical protein
VNKFLHPPMQALKQAAREGDQVRLDAVCEEWSVSAAAEPKPERTPELLALAEESIKNPETEPAVRP